MIFKTLSVATLLLFTACKSESKEDSSSATKEKAVSSSDNALPKTSKSIALNTDGNTIPATIEMPTGSTIFADSPTMLRVGFDGKDSMGRRESLFAVQVQKGNEYNLDLTQTAKDLGENKYGATNKILEQSEGLLLYKTTMEGGHISHYFSVIIDLDGDKWLCKQGNDGGWSEKQARAQLAACKTLKSI